MKIITTAILLFLTYNIILPQEGDTTITMPAADSIQIAVVDTTVVEDSVDQKRTFELEDVVYANSTDSLIFDVKARKMFIFGSGELKYKQTELKAGSISVDFPTNQLDATGVIDTSDSTGKRFIQTPVLSEAGENYEGANIKYNFKSQRGFISLAKNIQTESRYEGAKVKKVDKNVYFIEDGIYTTCEQDTPHTYFTADEMKVIQNDKIIAKWVFLHVGGVPLPLPLPFGVFPHQSGRRSGILPPVYGQAATQGQFFKGFGYFWAINDYMDLKLTGDYYSKGGFGTAARYRYAQRYDLNGNINAGYSVLTSGEENDPSYTERREWNLSVFHHQDFTPSMRLNVNLQFLSSNYISDNSTNLNELLRQDIISNATFNKRWSESGTNLTINYSRTQNLETGDLSESLPNLTFSKSLTHPFKSTSATRGEEKWYELIGYTYSGNFKNNRNKSGGDLKIRGGIQHNIGLSASPKIGHFSISPRISYQEKWYNKQIRKNSSVTSEFDTTSGTTIFNEEIITTDIHKIDFVRTFNFSLSASTKIYGMANPNMFGIEAFRHTITPSISYNYKPDYSKSFWGYYDSYKDKDGNIVEYDKFGNEIFGGASRGESQSLNISVGNIFEIKTTKDPTDTLSKAKKINLLNLNLSTGYNFAADSLKLRDLRVSYRTQIGDLLNFSGSSSFTFYDYNESRRINEFLVSKGKGLFRMTNLSISVSTSISGEKIKGDDRTGKRPEDEQQEYSAFSKSDYVTLYEEEPPDFSIPWNLTLNYNFNYSKPTPTPGIQSSSLGLNLGFNLTENWKFKVSGSYDLERKEISAPQISIYRDLHCWEMNFNWNPIGTYRGFRFEIRIKSPELQDIKVTKSKGLYTGRR